MEPLIKEFFKSPAFAVVGASNDRKKFGNKVLRCYLQHDLIVYPVNLNETTVENLKCFKHISELPEKVTSISIITQPSVTEHIVDDAIAKGIKNIWMQPGAESEKAIAKARAHQINVIANGPCVLVELGFRDV